MKKNLCIHLTDSNLIEKIDGLTNNGKSMSYKDFASTVFLQYFQSRIIQLKSMGIDKLAEYTLSLEEMRGSEKKHGTKED